MSDFSIVVVWYSNLYCCHIVTFEIGGLQRKFVKELLATNPLYYDQAFLDYVASMRIYRKEIRILHIHVSKADQKDTVTKIFAERLKAKSYRRLTLVSLTPIMIVVLKNWAVPAVAVTCMCATRITDLKYKAHGTA